MSQTSSELALLARFSTAVEAHILVGRLRNEGIEAMVLDEYLVTTNWLYSQAIGGVRVVVPVSQLQLAQEILAADTKEESPELEANPETAPTCPSCFSDQTEYYRKYLGTALTWLLLGLPLLLPTKHRQCKNCGHRWQV